MGVFKGEVTALPPDKSISHRAALIGSLAEGVTEITNFSAGFDNQSTLGVLRDAGIGIIQEEVAGAYGRPVRKVIVTSRGLWSFIAPQKPLMCNNSGSTMRMFAGILAAQPFESELVGDSSLMKRPMKRIADPLRMMGAMIELSQAGTAPVRIKGDKDLSPIDYRLPVPSAQVKSLVAFAALHADGESRIQEPVRSRDHTELMLGLETLDTPDGQRTIIIQGRKTIPARPFHVPSDPSAACFLVALALLGVGSEIIIRDVCLNPTRVEFIPVLRGAGADITIENSRVIGGECIGDILVRSTVGLNPLVISNRTVVAGVIDELPMLSVLSAFASGEFELHNAEELRTKESDRINAIVVNLERLGFDCEQYPDGFRVIGRRTRPSGTVAVECFDDHRIAMSFAVAARATGEAIELSQTDVVGVSFPNFFDIIDSLTL
ncbi:MAG: 3-phosphoshikimate 1-carboxyvinyltransferase [Chlorobium sp.]|uniref:3-phosphoshikimate 1-carboxyvinyltransferase n=1 Tax=Chlorobium sp. TaxID=1095 RepID=UPI0025BE0ECD|nr:3-phosphoshikimate 1-carboxyvinyltransferase [Chlorobium sp.]MCF8383468.1 3-phosphoshikimate 1-carboxyvinyltransferase [Chlorobium sp.]